MDLHPHIAARKLRGAPQVADVHRLDAARSKTAKFNTWLAVKVTTGVGTMWCAYAFTILALVSLGDAIQGGRATLIAWIAQTFLQLVLLSIIIVGQNIAAAASDLRSVATYDDAEAVLHTSLELEAHLERQDEMIASLTARLEAVASRLEGDVDAASRQRRTRAKAAPAKAAPAKAAPAKAAPAKAGRSRRETPTV